MLSIVILLESEIAKVNKEISQLFSHILINNIEVILPYIFNPDPNYRSRDEIQLLIFTKKSTFCKNIK